jgi:hypothetical protein
VAEGEERERWEYKHEMMHHGFRDKREEREKRVKRE